MLESEGKIREKPASSPEAYQRPRLLSTFSYRLVTVKHRTNTCPKNLHKQGDAIDLNLPYEYERLRNG